MATYAERLVEAEAAYHDLLTGKSAVEFRDGNGETVRYTPATRSALAAYIRELKQLIANEDAGIAPCEGPMRVIFI